MKKLFIFIMLLALTIPCYSQAGLNIGGRSPIVINGVQYEAGNSGIDASTEAQMNIGYEHHEIHSGSHYNYCDYILGLGSSVVTEFVITTASTTSQMHLTFEAFSVTGATLELFEGASGITGGTVLTPRNNNRNSLNTSGVILLGEPVSVAADGTRAAGYLLGGNRAAGATSRDNELILKPNTIYLVRITTTASSNAISFCAEWYEHVPKN